MTHLKGFNMLKIQDAAQALAEASKRHCDAKLAAQAARTIETSALNELNEAQKNFDKVVAGIRDSAASESDWKARVGRSIVERD